MKYWDASAIVPLFVRQTTSASLRDLCSGDPQVMAWTLTEIEFRSAVWRLMREGTVGAEEARQAVFRFDAFWSEVDVIALVEPVKLRAKRILGVHPLRAADSLQLAAALTAVNDEPTGWEFVTLDRHLREAAQREGFRVLP